VTQGDPLVFFNFRPDRARQICHALLPSLGLLVTMTRYDDTLGALVAFDDEPLHGTLADALEASGLRQLHVAETEKYAHVTYFFDGGREHRHEGEDWELVRSRRDVPTYDHAPEMSAAGVAQRLAERLPDGYAFAVVNLANPDMVGHSGVLPAVIQAVEASDAALGVILEAVERAGGTALVTADHGNAERMLEPDGSPHTAHTTNPVPLICTLPGAHLRDGGKLGDLAPTVLALLGVAAPPEMTGRSLLV
jgi:2,3-bisphosphoglycerate-independent phosphoglycerate mutase